MASSAADSAYEPRERWSVQRHRGHLRFLTSNPASLSWWPLRASWSTAQVEAAILHTPSPFVTFRDETLQGTCLCFKPIRLRQHQAVLSTAGMPILFGQRVLLRHVRSRRLVAVCEGSGASENGCLRAELSGALSILALELRCFREWLPDLPIARCCPWLRNHSPIGALPRNSFS